MEIFIAAEMLVRLSYPGHFPMHQYVHSMITQEELL